MQFRLEDIDTPFVAPLEDKGHRFMPLFHLRSVHPCHALSVFLTGPFIRGAYMMTAPSTLRPGPDKRSH